MNRRFNLGQETSTVSAPIMRPAFYVSLLFALLFPLSILPALAADERGSAEVGIVADLTGASTTDLVNIHLIGKTDKALLKEIVRKLGEKCHAQPTQLKFKVGDPDVVDDKGIGLDFHLPVVPRGEGYLPITPFIETLAPYASQVRILYVIQGPFTYRGYQRYEHRDVTFTVDPPETTPSGSSAPFAFYGVNAIIRSPNLTLDIPPYPAEPVKQDHRRFPLLAMVAIAGVIGAVVGLLLTFLLPRRPTAMTWRGREISRGDKHVRTGVE